MVSTPRPTSPSLCAVLRGLRRYDSGHVQLSLLLWSKINQSGVIEDNRQGNSHQAHNGRDNHGAAEVVVDHDWYALPDTEQTEVAEEAVVQGEGGVGLSMTLQMITWAERKSQVRCSRFLSGWALSSLAGLVCLTSYQAKV